MQESDPLASKDFYWIDIKLPAHVEDPVAGSLLNALNDIALSATAIRADNKYRNDWQLRWMVEGTPDKNEIMLRIALALQIENLPLTVTADDISIEPVPDIDWLAHSYQEFSPFSIGDFYIYGSHYTGEKPDDKILLQIDAATAFGSGEHGTTAGCLEALQDISKQGFIPGSTLDLGTGSGILAIATWKLWQTPVLATDIDAESVRVTEVHAAINQTPLRKDALLTASGDGFNIPELQSGRIFDLVIANILAGPLITMAEDLIARVAPQGYVLLSGMLQEQATEVMAAYTNLGLSLVKRYDREEWASLLLQK